ncbi:hypothetical protein [Pseudonocardia xinjiangensis]|uniref:DUF5709 domain-containing protein n=1 Tax=Pseudonocardia xinjiangensis TaxID=75289 RepID=A0ABX1RQT7_9PSEU|nr:hypothetical protein [Pseudonocardia xinjiangensis]NMH81455.1 hypothetical protein [Pseudonocardia xinjiangensis]
MERGSSKHSPREDDALADELAGQLGPGGSNREEWADPEPPADDDPPTRTDLPAAGAGNDPEDPAGMSGDEMSRAQHDMAVANDWNPGENDT